MSSLHEECGVFGVWSPAVASVARQTYYGLYALQHRGQESCGIVVSGDGRFHSFVDAGTVEDVFTKPVMEMLGDGNMAIGHVRYGTKDAPGRLNAQPIVVNHVKGKLAIANNGSLVNYYELREEMEMQGKIFHSTSDAELIAHAITKERLNTDTLEHAISLAMNKLVGSYSIVIMTPYKLIAVRDPKGFHPLCFGKTEEGEVFVASESCALDAVGAAFERDLQPGEILIIDEKGIRNNTDHCGTQPCSACVFEYIYFARPDSVIDGASVHEARLRAGAFLALDHPAQADVVVGVPDSGLDAAIGFSRQSGIPYGLGFIKNKYIGRTFIVPGQNVREDKVRIKLNPVSATVKGKRVVLVDDSIVRGTTSARIVKLLREAGATEVHMRISSPPFLNPCYYGTDIESREALIACRHTLDEIRDIIGVDSLGFLSLEGAHKIATANDGISFCTACFDGKYPTAEFDESAKIRFMKKIEERE